MLHKTSSSSPTKARAHNTRPRIAPEFEDISFARKSRPYNHASRRPFLSRLDLWLSGFAPAAVRPWLLGIPGCPTIALLYCLLSVVVLSGYLCCDVWAVTPKNTSPLGWLFVLCVGRSLMRDQIPPFWKGFYWTSFWRKFLLCTPCPQ